MATEDIDQTDATGGAPEAPGPGGAAADRMLLAAVEAAPLGFGVIGPGTGDRRTALIGANAALTRAVNADALARYAARAGAATPPMRVSDGLERDAEGPWRLRLFPVLDGAEAVVGVVVEEIDDLLAGERAALSGVVSERILAQQTIDALATQLAILDDRGRILMVNRAWREFGAAEDSGGRDFVGDDYLAVCLADDEEEAGVRAFGEGLRDLLAGRREHVEFEYPCHSPTEQRWFLARGARFTSGDAARVVVSHENITARRRSEMLHRGIAETLQESLLPSVLPRVSGLEMAARYRAQGEGLEVGGDFYDVFAHGDDWLLVIGDVCGKGPAAAAVTAEARWTIRALADSAETPARLLALANRALVGRRSDSSFLSAAIARVTARAAGARVACARAGHPAPLILRAGGAVEEVGGRGGLLGLFEDVRFEDAAADLGPGDALVMFTDGVSEARRGPDELGPDGVRAALAGAAGLGAEAIARHLEQAALAFSGGPLHDDVAIVVVRATPGSAAEADGPTP